MSAKSWTDGGAALARKHLPRNPGLDKGVYHMANMGSSPDNSRYLRPVPSAIAIMKSSLARSAFACALFLALLLPLAGPAHAQGPTPYPSPDNPADWPGKGPIRVFDWMSQNREHFWKSREKDQGAVVFTGDSLTQGWKTLREAFPDLKVANRGIGGDVSRGLLFRFREDVLELNPRAVVILVGTNDLSAHANPSDTLQNLNDILAQARETFPEMPVVVCTVPPRESDKAPTKPGATEDLNAGILTMGADDRHFAVLDLHSLLSKPDGGADLENFHKDGIHLAEPGYAKWGEALRPVLEKLGVN
jgi:lysophospholipase L1-like esterase